MSIWRREDQLKTLAFGLAGWGCWMSYSAADITSIFGRGALLIGGFIFSMAGVVLALEIGNRKFRQSKEYAN